jgi:hypothetical protein
LASPYVRHAPVENLVLVRERDRRRARELARLLLVLVPVAAALLGYTWLQAEILQAGYDVRSLERALEREARTESHLRLEISRHESLDRVVAEASERLNMVFPAIEQMVFLEPRR